jgi:hypothetical protein
MLTFKISASSSSSSVDPVTFGANAVFNANRILDKNLDTRQPQHKDVLMYYQDTDTYIPSTVANPYDTTGKTVRIGNTLLPQLTNYVVFEFNTKTQVAASYHIKITAELEVNGVHHKIDQGFYISDTIFEEDPFSIFSDMVIYQKDGNKFKGLVTPQLNIVHYSFHVLIKPINLLYSDCEMLVQDGINTQVIREK